MLFIGSVFDDFRVFLCELEEGDHIIRATALTSTDDALNFTLVCLRALTAAQSIEFQFRYSAFMPGSYDLAA